MTPDRSVISVATLVQDFFSQRLLTQRNASPQTIASYRDTFRLLLVFAQHHAKKEPSSLSHDDLDAPLILAFLDHLEHTRHNSIRSRNARLAAIRSFMHYVALREPTALPHVQRILAIPMKRFDRPLLGFLSREEMQAIIDAPDNSTRAGQRDQVMFATFYNTGARVSELIALKIGDVTLEGSACVRLHGKGRKERVIPLWQSTTKRIKAWLRYLDPQPASPVFPNRASQLMTRAGVEHRLRVAVRNATARCPSLGQKNVSPHTLRHTTAMHLLQSGVDITTIALWLGHESPSTTHLYIEADLTMKERALEKLQDLSAKTARCHVSDPVLAFLERL
jgi:site-specific recombinase XerD